MLVRFFYVWHGVVGRFGAPFRRLAKPLRRAYWTAFVQRKALFAGDGLRVNGRTIIPGRSVRIGRNCHFNGMYVHGSGGLTIGDNFHSGTGCQVITVNHKWRDGEALPYDATVVERPVSIADNVWLGNDVLVLPGAVIGEGVVVGAGSVVHGTIEPLAVVAGNPARPVSHRDADHYTRLKADGRFH